MKESSEEAMVWELDAALSHLCRGPWYSRSGGLRGMWKVARFGYQ